MKLPMVGMYCLLLGIILLVALVLHIPLWAEWGIVGALVMAYIFGWRTGKQYRPS